jgi:hypothetical protein
MKMEQAECFETSTYTIQTPGNYPEENMQHAEHGERLKSSLSLCPAKATEAINKIYKILVIQDLLCRLVNTCHVLVAKPEGKRPLGETNHRWEGNI